MTTKLNLISMVLLKKYSLQLFNTTAILLILASCEKTNIPKKELKLNLLVKEGMYSDSVIAYTNDSLLCIYKNDNIYSVWKNGFPVKNNKSILSMIKENAKNKILRSYKYQTEFMNLDFNNPINFQKSYNKVTKWDTKYYQIIKKGGNYFLMMEGYNELKLPVANGNDMDWVTFRGIDINNDKMPELFIFHYYYNSKTDEEYGNTDVYEVKN